MADNYMEFSEVLPNLTTEEEAWLRRQLEVVCVIDHREYAEDSPLVAQEFAAGKDPEWCGCRVFRDMQDYYSDESEEAGFEYEFRDDSEGRDGWGHNLWFHAEEYSCVDRIAHLVQKFLKEFRPDQCWSLTYACGCAKPRVGEFGGGAIFVTAAGTRWESTYDFVDRARREFLEEHPEQEKP